MDGDDGTDLKHFLIARLQSNRDAVLWKIDGVDDYDLRRPLPPTGTNLLGLVKHLAACEFGYFGDTFGQREGLPQPWLDGDWEDENADMWATQDESVDDIVGLYRAAWEHAQKTFDASDIDTPGAVPWWAPDNAVTLGQILVHMLGETARHAGHTDILRETVDGAAGLYEPNDNMAHKEASAVRDYVAKLQAVADAVRGPR